MASTTPTQGKRSERQWESQAATNTGSRHRSDSVPVSERRPLKQPHSDTGETSSVAGMCSCASPQPQPLSAGDKVRVFSHSAGQWVDGKFCNFVDDDNVTMLWVEYKIPMDDNIYGKMVPLNSEKLCVTNADGNPITAAECKAPADVTKMQPGSMEDEKQKMKAKQLEWQQQIDAKVKQWQLESSHILDVGRKMENLRAPDDKPEQWWRQKILLETLDMLKNPSLRSAKREQALLNLALWKLNCNKSVQPKAYPASPAVEIVIMAGDWGEVTLWLTKAYGDMFAVLNMAHAECPGGGGGYVHGTAAQEENMFRRTDCHFGLEREQMQVTEEGFRSVLPGDYVYTKEETALINACAGSVLLDCKNPRVCFRGKEVNGKSESGYEVLPESLWFPFYEFKAAAMDLRVKPDGMPRPKDEQAAAFDKEDMKTRLRAQLATLQKAGIQHAVLSAFGCGAFANPPQGVAEAYAEIVPEFASSFQVIAFAIFYPGYGPMDNFDIFSSVLQKLDGRRTEGGLGRKMRVQCRHALPALPETP